jgi:hypothetical protein
MRWKWRGNDPSPSMAAEVWKNSTVLADKAAGKQTTNNK